MSRRAALCLTAIALLILVVSKSLADDPSASAPALSGKSSDTNPATAATDQPDPKGNALEGPTGLAAVAKLRGRIEADAVMVSQSTASKLLIGNLQNGYGFRRARIGAEGTIASSARWVAEIDFAGGNVRLRDVFVGLTALPVVRQVNVGYFREPFSLEGATSSRFITFLERSPLNQLDPTRNWGVAGYWWPQNERMTVAVGAFRDGTNSGGFSTGNDHAWAVTTRLTGLPLYENREGAFELLHLGAAFSQRSPSGGVVSYVVAPQSSLLTVPDNPVSPFLPPVVVPSNSQQLYNLQSAWVRGPLSVQGEWIATTIQQIEGGVVFLHGFYADLSYFLTGEHRGYDRTRAAFDRVSVRKPVVRSSDTTVTGCGAWELTTRFSVANFASSNLPLPSSGFGPTSGTVLYQTTCGVNWYLNDYTRVMMNYTLAVPEMSGFPALPVHVFGVRTAIYW